MQTARNIVSMTEEEYIQYELKSDIRHEFVNGELIDMQGEYLLNNRIAGNLYFILRLILEEMGYQIFTHDAKLKIPDEKIYFYPDLFVTNEILDEKQYVATSAILVAEVLSKSTRAYDTLDKLLQYRKLPDLRYYLMIEPFKRIVTVWSKNNEGEWDTEYFIQPSEIIYLEALSVKFTLKDLYR